ncbi:MAG: transporter substrate-binding domain-containing protein [Gammaproteobacteria bacterium]|nr:transporter substrate-binding domain-containing protein [Gammaproteobacteria bacterium]
MTKNTVTFIALGLMFVISTLAKADVVSIAAVKIDGLLQEDGKGLYDQIISAVGRTDGIRYEVVPLTPKLALASFESGERDCLAPANINPDFYNLSIDTVASKSLAEAKIYLFTKTGSQPTHDLSLFAGRKVGVRSGISYGNKVKNSAIRPVAALTIEANIKNLEDGRIDAFLAYWPDAYSVFDVMGIPELPHDVDNPIAVHEDSLVCRANEKGKTIVNRFNEGLGKLESSGELARISGNNNDHR